MPTCPNGHQSGSDDWCEVCGHRMGAVPPPPPPPPPAFQQGPPPQGGYGYPGPAAPAAPAELCPQCRTPREGNTPFCEECRWNFLTQKATSYTPLAPQPAPAQGQGLNLPPGFQSPPGPPGRPVSPQPRDPYEYQSSRPSQVNRPAEPLTGAPGAQQGPPSFRQPPPAAPNGEAAGRPGPPPSFPQGPPAPPAFTQAGPPAPPTFPRRSEADDDWPQPQPQPTAPGDDWPRHTEAPGDDWPRRAEAGDDWPQRTEAGDDWMIQPPAQTGPPQHVQPPAPPQQTQAPQQPQQHRPPQQTFQAPPPQPLGWTVTIGPDRDYFMAMMQRSGPEAAGLNLPAYSPEQQRPLTGSQLTIGRRRHSTGEAPDIDLAVPPEDPGVSHQHAVLVQQPDGGWAVVDQNSTNGTTINGAEEPIQPYVPVALQDGDRVHVGAWTTLTVRRG
ncbi:FHA domain-containing protein [Streptomyces sp. cg36]|uniref:FHA domain-containing protein n=1 Tax=Streptomyces sp. cg36 TaxID=3238798 RepID=UPI0034E1F9CC